MANNKEFNFLKMFYDVKQLCFTEEICGTCKEKGCLVGYARAAIGEAKKKDTDTIIGWHRDIPNYDINGGYDKHDAMEAIAHTLQQCKSCKDIHTKDCLVNIIRCCYDIIAFGDEQPYIGSTFSYLAMLQEKDEEAAAFISEIYKTHTDPM